MENEEALSFKFQVFDQVSRLVNEEILNLKKQLEDLKEAVANDTKSTAGDKHETGRAMTQLEIEKCAHLLQQQLLIKKGLTPPLRKSYEKVERGVLVKTNEEWFYLLVSYGRVNLEGKNVFVLSAVSPLAKLLLGKGVGDEVVLNGKKYSILRIT